MHHLRFYKISAQSDFKYGYQAAIYLLGIIYGFFTRGELNGPGHFITRNIPITM
jgi:hypothetical protein